MFSNLVDQFFAGGTRPNRFTTGMGKLIKAAREEAGVSQRDLAERIYRRQAALSDMENGKMEPDASTLLLLSEYLKKPISYFFPILERPGSEDKLRNDQIQEIIIQARRLSSDDLRRIIAQIRAIANLE